MMKRFTFLLLLFFMYDAYATENKHSQHLHLSAGISNAHTHERFSSGDIQTLGVAFHNEYLFNALVLDLGYTYSFKNSVIGVNISLLSHLSRSDQCFSGYFSVPLLVGPEIGNQFRFLFLFGPHLGYLHTSGRNNDISAFDVGFVLQPQFIFKLSERFDYVLSASYQHGFAMVERMVSSSKTGDAVNRRFQFRGINLLSLGVRYGF